MKIILCFSITAFLYLSCFAQINTDDSTISVIGYWNKHDKQTYTITEEKIKIKDDDTTSYETMKYEVEILIQDSTEKSYTISWKYKNFQTSSENKFTKKLMSITDKLDVIIRTDEMGTVEEVVNWKEIRDHINKALDEVVKEFSDVRKIKEICEQVGSTFTSKEAIESVAIKDILQLHTFHGGKYTLKEVVAGKIKLPNIFGGEPFDADVEVEFTELDTVNNSAVIRYVHIFDEQQVGDATFSYLKKSAITAGAPEPKREDVPPIYIQERISSNIHGPSGWVLYSISIKESSSGNVNTIDTREIELK